MSDFVLVKQGGDQGASARRPLGLSGAMITEYPLEDRRYDEPDCEPFWPVASDLAGTGLWPR